MSSHSNLELTEISEGDLAFVIMNAPTEKNIFAYVKELKKKNVSTIVRVCEPTYEKQRCVEEGLEVKDFPFTDGAAPPAEVISNWLDVVHAETAKKSAVAVHCVAGLGRAPVLVVIALIEYGGMDPTEAITLVREKRYGAINQKQLQYLTGYKPTRIAPNSCGNCTIS